MAAPPPPPPKAGGGMSLYANLLNPKAADASTSATASITGAPVVYDSGDKDDASRKEAIPAMRFQPIIRRPQANQKKPPKPGFPKAIPQQPPQAPLPPTTAASTGETNKDVTGSATAAAATQPSDLQSQAQRTTLADWAATEDDEYLWGAGEKRQRGGRKAARKRKKNAQDGGGGGRQRETDWDEIYDPARPTNVDEYLRSEERIREVQEWKAVLYAHRRRRKGSYDESSEEEEEEDEDGDGERRGMGLANQFAPPAEYSFAPPPMSPPPREAPAPVPDDATGDDAYARRLALSGMAPPPPTDTPTPPPPPPPPEEPVQDSATITRGPVRYEAPPQPSPAPHDAMDVDDDDDDDDDNIGNIDLPPALGLGAPDAEGEAQQSRTNRPGQKGFAQRLMSKYGWTAGKGLGASSSGIINPLSVKVEKRKRRPDAEGGGFVEPGGRGKIVGGKTAPAGAADDGQEDGSSSSKFGPMSEVVVLRNMLEGMDNLEGEISDGLGQEIGEECGDKYGRVERLYIDVGGRQVFIKFTDAVSALRAVNALEGRVFNGNAIAARFWDADKFEKGIYGGPL